MIFSTNPYHIFAGLNRLPVFCVLLAAYFIFCQLSYFLTFYFLLMRLKLPIFILLFVFALGFYSCLYKESLEAPAAELQEEIIPDDGEFSILSAKIFLTIRFRVSVF